MPGERAALDPFKRFSSYFFKEMYVSVFHRRHKLAAYSFSSWEAAAAFLRGGRKDEQILPVAIWQADTNHLWIWCEHTRLRLTRARAMRDVRTVVSLPAYHVFGTIEEFE